MDQKKIRYSDLHWTLKLPIVFEYVIIALYVIAIIAGVAIEMMKVN